ncbi:GNAT family N-acetyltransferase [Sulfuricurvum sp.]|uniref:GNAT family N-acetyltransferase n=1 Tax=Sulfuricurvum sp. TaxID=2025608 RepID=UPI00263380F2|nr:GNAT family N-acetyltransferase [Sulfuricurvum sp.]MDD3596946.1 GNAT family N-acetyltransferase [Sulfuricurvum sp.]
MKFEWITNWDTIWSEPFQSRWREWIDKAENTHIFFHPEMVRVWIDTYFSLRELHPMFCVAYNENTTIFLPLILWKKNWKNAFMHTIIPAGYSDFDYHEPLLIGQTTDMIFFWTALLEECRLQNFQYDELLTDDIFNAIQNPLFQKQRNELCPYIDLKNHQTLEEYLNTLSKSSRKDLKRSARILGENGTLRYEVLNTEEALETLPIMIKTHQERYPNAYKAPSFHENLIKYLLTKGLLHFSVLILENNIISWRIGFTFKEVYYSYMPVFDSTYAKFAPSKVHLLLTIEDMLKRKYHTYDLMRGAKSYKNLFTDQTKEIYSYTVYSFSPTSRLKQWLQNAKSTFK